MSTDTSPNQSASSQEGDFDARHKKELSGRTFASQKTREFFLPLIATAMGGVVGYYTLGKPIRKLFPKAFKIIDHGTDIITHLGDLGGDSFTKAAATIQETLPELVAKVKAENPSFEIKKAKHAWKVLNAGTEQDAIKIKDALGIPTKEHKDFSRWIGAGVLGMIASIPVSIYLGFDKWRKEESTRLAAAEINRDISRLEVFNKRDPELIAENKRLRALVGEKEKAMPSPEINTVTHEGAVHGHVLQRA